MVALPGLDVDVVVADVDGLIRRLVADLDVLLGGDPRRQVTASDVARSVLREQGLPALAGHVGREGEGDGARLLGQTIHVRDIDERAGRAVGALAIVADAGEDHAGEHRVRGFVDHRPRRRRAGRDVAGKLEAAAVEVRVVDEAFGVLDDRAEVPLVVAGVVADDLGAVRERRGLERARRCQRLLDLVDGLDDAVGDASVGDDRLGIDEVAMDDDLADQILGVGAPAAALVRIDGDDRDRVVEDAVAVGVDELVLDLRRDGVADNRDGVLAGVEVGAGAAQEQVGTAPAFEHVVARAAVEDIVAVAALDVVAVGAADQLIVAAAADQVIVAGKAVKRVVARRDRLRARRRGQRRPGTVLVELRDLVGRQHVLRCEAAPNAEVGDGAVEGVMQVFMVGGEVLGRVVVDRARGVGAEDPRLLVLQDVGFRLQARQILVALL